MDKKLDRETILARSRNENFDEGLAAAEDRGRKLGRTVFGVVAVGLLLFSLHRESDAFYAILPLIFLFAAADYYPLYRFTRKRRHLYLAVLNSVLSVLGVAAFVRVVLG